MNRCAECAGRRLAFESAFAAVAYHGPAPAIVRAWKELGLRRVAPLAAGLVAERVLQPAADVITYIPPDGDRSVRRGLHPPRELAAAIGGHWRVPVEVLLTRARPVARQTGLSRAGRRRNMRGAFRAERNGAPPRVVLIDDVYTTGATVDAAARALRSAGASEVHVVTFARTVR